jgi:hypothetical protein
MAASRDLQTRLDRLSPLHSGAAAATGFVPLSRLVRLDRRICWLLVASPS